MDSAVSSFHIAGIFESPSIAQLRAELDNQSSRDEVSKIDYDALSIKFYLCSYHISQTKPAKVT